MINLIHQILSCHKKKRDDQLYLRWGKEWIREDFPVRMTIEMNLEDTQKFNS